MPKMHLYTIAVWILNVPERFMCWRTSPQCNNVQCVALGEWLGDERSDLINWLTHWWIHNWIDYWEVVETVGGGTQFKEVSHWGLPCKGISYFWSFPLKCFLLLCLLAIVRRAGPETVQSNDHKQKPLKLWAKMYLSSFKLFSSICHNDRKLTHSFSSIHISLL